MLKQLLTKPVNLISQLCDALAPVADLLIRMWLFKVFFVSGLTKIQSWPTTLMLFKNEYHVPILSPEVAAILGTAAELGLPLLILIGIGGRLPAIGLFAFNIIAVVSYQSFLLSPVGAAGLMQHILWGFMILSIISHGHGTLSIDRLLNKLNSHYHY